MASYWRVLWTRYSVIQQGLQGGNLSSVREECFHLEGFVFNRWQVNVSSASVVVVGLLKGMTNTPWATLYFNTLVCLLNGTFLSFVKLKEPSRGFCFVTFSFFPRTFQLTFSLLFGGLCLCFFPRRKQNSLVGNLYSVFARPKNWPQSYGFRRIDWHRYPGPQIMN